MWTKAANSAAAMLSRGINGGDLVRVVEIGDYSIELCGGTHVHHTGEVAPFAAQDIRAGYRTRREADGSQWSLPE